VLENRRKWFSTSVFGPSDSNLKLGPKREPTKPNTKLKNEDLTMSEYTVTWSIQVTADNALEAALIAEDVQYNQIVDRLNGGCFVVKNLDRNEVEDIDLEEYYVKRAEDDDRDKKDYESREDEHFEG
jgi:hypothetical protein